MPIFSDNLVFEKLHKECLKKKRLWEDPDFKATDSSVYYNECPVDGDIEWKRPNVSNHYHSFS